jgi:hypothetical protein
VSNYLQLVVELKGSALAPEVRSEELQRIVSGAARKIGEGYVAGRLLDVNGNTVGSWGLVDDLAPMP